jgi:DNA-binding MarR family transcriptional regulator
VDSPFGDAAVTRAELVRLLQRHAVEAVRLNRAFAEHHDMHPTDWSALLAVMQGDRSGTPLSPGELGQRLGMSSGATTAVVDRLERAGHVRRVPDERDRRRLTLHRAENAAALLAAFVDPLNASMDTLMIGYSGPELAAVQRFLAEAVGQIGDHRRRLGERSTAVQAQPVAGRDTAISPPSA